MTARWTSERVELSGDRFFAAIADEIRAARRTVDLEAFRFRGDAAGRPVAEALADAAHRGVRVRVLVDGYGSWRLPWELLPLLTESGADVRLYNPLPLVHGGRATGRRLSELGRRLGRIHRRDHRKLLVIDRTVAWTGSRNLCAVHSSAGEEPAWNDTSVRLEGPPVDELVLSFEQLWHGRSRLDRRRTNTDLTPPSGCEPPLVWLNSTQRLRRRLLSRLVDLLGRARYRVWLATTYFVPKPSVLGALVEAAERGVDVRLVVPGRSDIPFMSWVAAAHYPRLLEAGVRVFEFFPAVNLHAKDLVVDHRCLVGSTNINHRSFVHDLELQVALCSGDARAALVEEMERRFRRSREIRPDDLWGDRLVRRLLGRVMLLGRTQL